MKDGNAGSQKLATVEQESMHSISEDVTELSSYRTSQIRLIGWESQKGKDNGELAVFPPTNKHFL